MCHPNKIQTNSPPNTPFTLVDQNDVIKSQLNGQTEYKYRCVYPIAWQSIYTYSVYTCADLLVQIHSYLVVLIYYHAIVTCIKRHDEGLLGACKTMPFLSILGCLKSKVWEFTTRFWKDRSQQVQQYAGPKFDETRCPETTITQKMSMASFITNMQLHLRLSES